MLCNRVLFRFKQNFQDFQHKWSYDKMLIDWVRSGRRKNNIWLSVRTSWPRAKYFPVRPSHSVNKYIFHDLSFFQSNNVNAHYITTPKVQKKINSWLISQSFDFFIHIRGNVAIKTRECPLFLVKLNGHYRNKNYFDCFYLNIWVHFVGALLSIVKSKLQGVIQKRRKNWLTKLYFGNILNIRSL